MLSRFSYSRARALVFSHELTEFAAQLKCFCCLFQVYFFFLLFPLCDFLKFLLLFSSHVQTLTTNIAKNLLLSLVKNVFCFFFYLQQVKLQSIENNSNERKKWTQFDQKRTQSVDSANESKLICADYSESVEVKCCELIICSFLALYCLCSRPRARTNNDLKSR